MPSKSSTKCMSTSNSPPPRKICSEKRKLFLEVLSLNIWHPFCGVYKWWNYFYCRLMKNPKNHPKYFFRNEYYFIIIMTLTACFLHRNRFHHLTCNVIFSSLPVFSLTQRPPFALTGYLVSPRFHCHFGLFHSPRMYRSSRSLGKYSMID